jgi:hypothetical protein
MQLTKLETASFMALMAEAVWRLASTTPTP